MAYQIAKGVQLQVVPTKKFKNTKVVINFTFPTNHRNFAKLALLAELLENASAKYNSEMLVSRKLSEMFGASYGVSVLRYGNQHTLQMKMTYPNDRFLPGDRDLTTQVFSFLKEMIENPLVNEGQFDAAYFKIHQTNMINYLDSIVDNKEYYATLQLQQLYYPNDPDHGAFLLGDVASFKQITPKQLYTYYLTILKTAEITILVGGDVATDKIQTELSRFRSFGDRQTAKYELRVIPAPVSQVATGEQILVGSQSILSMGYQLPIYFGDQDYFSAMIFNQLFGGSSQSLLFTNVREKKSLAYDIHSNYNSLFGMVTVQAGIDQKNKKQVSQMVPQQLNKIIAGDYDDQLLAGIKQALINQHRSEGDHLAALIDKQYLQQIMGFSIADTEWESQVNSVTRTAISAVAKQLQLRAVFTLNSEEGTNGVN